MADIESRVEWPVFFSQKGFVLMRRHSLQITVGRNRVLLTIYTHITFSNVELHFLNATSILALYGFINSFSFRNTSRIISIGCSPWSLYIYGDYQYVVS